MGAVTAETLKRLAASEESEVRGFREIENGVYLTVIDGDNCEVTESDTVGVVIQTKIEGGEYDKLSLQARIWDSYPNPNSEFYELNIANGSTEAEEAAKAKAGVKSVVDALMYQVLGSVEDEDVADGILDASQSVMVAYDESPDAYRDSMEQFLDMLSGRQLFMNARKNKKSGFVNGRVFMDIPSKQKWNGLSPDERAEHLLGSFERAKSRAKNVDSDESGGSF